ncbi:radical SAM protein [Methanoregula sp. UBA64]|jgi:wyosine [tRNA(Phe)-imidazoG37] synthetase (radical SAM superfamily)|uniref:radical SAM protein n=1 Tax=Methanoregula sp. UBA64 TaxID=1915554 RepID=UPI0025F6CAC8|nr:radical SAM protein [Methanoregula sp. UBA64]
MQRHIFGPVLSRRLGLSLGVDLVPFKVCSYDCAYCECGHTTEMTLARQEFVPAGVVMAELRRVLSTRPALDSITFAGSGEPTLSLALGPVIAAIKREFPEYTVSVLTNGSLLSDTAVQDELLPADRVIPTLSSVSQQTFERIHHPDPSLKIADIIDGMVSFRKRYTGQLWLELFIIPGLNTTDEELAGLKAAIGRIRPDYIQLNTLDRPPADTWVRAASASELERVRTVLGTTGIGIAGTTPPVSPGVMGRTAAADLMYAMLCRRPATVEDLVRVTGLSGDEVTEILGSFERDGKISSHRMERGVFYAIVPELPARKG